MVAAPLAGQASKFKGHLDGDGHNHKLPYLTRLAGGLKSWNAKVSQMPDGAQLPHPSNAENLTGSQKVWAEARKAAQLQGRRDGAARRS